MTAIFWRSPYNYDTEAASDEAAIPPDGHGESLTIQSMTEDTDLNKMLERMGVTGKFPENPRVPTFGDFSGVTDFQSALNAVLDAQDAFMEFPAEFRARFENDPQRMLEFCAKDENQDEMEKLGLLSPEAVARRVDARTKAAAEEAVKAAAKAAGAAKAP